jgi:hypothetical protein
VSKTENVSGGKTVIIEHKGTHEFFTVLSQSFPLLTISKILFASKINLPQGDEAREKIGLQTNGDAGKVKTDGER